MSSLAQPSAANSARAAVMADDVRARVLPWALMALGLVARLIRIGANGLRTDEIYSVWMSQRSLAAMLRAIVLEGHDATPPTFYVLLHGMLEVSWALWSVRLISVLAGTALVGATFLLARYLFDFRVAALSALLLALAPFNIEISQVARTYALTSVLAIASLYFFARLSRPTTPPGIVWLFAVCTIGAIATHYLAGLVLVFENLVVLALVLGGRLPRRKLIGWIRLQVVLGLASLPLAWMAVQRLPTGPAGHGQTWLAAPSANSLIKSLVMWGTGDPSHGPGTFSWPRLASLAVIVGILALGALTAWRLWLARPERRLEVGRVAYVAAAFFGIWGLAVGISFVRRIFDEQYFIYLAPLLLIVMSWSVLRARPVLLGRGLLAAWLGLSLIALFVFYTEPNGEQWREAMTYVRQGSQPGDVVLTSPGYYIRSAGYYYIGQLPGVDYTLGHAPYGLVSQQGYVGADDPAEEMDLPEVDQALAGVERVWFVTGYTKPDPARLAWFTQHYSVISQRDFLGVRVMLGQRVPPVTSALPDLAAP